MNKRTLNKILRFVPDDATIRVNGQDIEALLQQDEMGNWYLVLVLTAPGTTEPAPAARSDEDA